MSLTSSFVPQVARLKQVNGVETGLRSTELENNLQSARHQFLQGHHGEQ
jgi:hypothetical protein